MHLRKHIKLDKIKSILCTAPDHSSMDSSTKHTISYLRNDVHLVNNEHSAEEQHKLERVYSISHHKKKKRKSERISTTSSKTLAVEDRVSNLNRNKCDRKELKSALKRLLQPNRTYYELEWQNNNEKRSNQHKSWVQLDEVTSAGIERVRRLGFQNVDITLNSSLIDKPVSNNSLIEISFNCNLQKKIIIPDSQTQLVRLRRVHWWSKDYSLAKVYTSDMPM
ncbi:hypothetical protein BDB01DRAFT_773637 [Pilobolus umbonatus]|nr:hypothetical protein BDB01DRAFT_773637 [Pilobolus umbonatus]